MAGVLGHFSVSHVALWLPKKEDSGCGQASRPRYYTPRASRLPIVALWEIRVVREFDDFILFAYLTVVEGALAEAAGKIDSSILSQRVIALVILRAAARSEVSGMGYYNDVVR